MRWIGLALVGIALLAPTACEGKAKLKPEQRYNRLWRKVDWFYGQEGKPPPPLEIRKPTDNPGATGEAPTGTVVIHPGTARQLASRKPLARKTGRQTPLHEWTHLFGPRGSGATPDESVAYRFQNKVSHQLNKQQAKRLARKRGLREILK